MKYYIHSCLLVFLVFTSCQSERAKPTSTSSTTAKQYANDITRTMDDDVDCYFAQNIQVQVKVIGDVMEGQFQVNSALENVSGTLTGKDYGEDFIADLTYTVGDKTHREKVIINIVANTMNFARSGSVEVDGERMERNSGESTMDQLLRKSCK